MILIVDFGSQTAHLIGRRLRSIGVSIRYANPHDTYSLAKEIHPSGIILSGGPASVYEPNAPSVEKELFSLGIPVLGICYGWQLMAHLLGGEVQSTTKEYGLQTVYSRQTKSILTGLPQSWRAILSHGDSVTQLPPGFYSLAKTDNVPNTVVIHSEQNLFGLQFHPEAEHTEYGTEILRYFSCTICKELANPLSLNPDEIIETIKSQVQNKKVIMAVSGGVDSTVAAFFIAKAIQKQLIPVYVDSGLMRPGTTQRVKDLFTHTVPLDLVIVQARERFLTLLQGITDPEQKRKIIGKLYIDIFDEIAQKYPDVAFLGQGTIYSDVIESKGSLHASHIKSHHNVGGLPQHMQLSLLEPLRTYYKDEVIKLGQNIGLSDEITSQQPFPGPGYAVRIRGEVTEKRLSQVIQADTIVVEEMQKHELYHKVFQCFALMSGAFSTAVKGDGRVFAEVVAIRAYESHDIMTSQWAHIPYEVLNTMATRIVNEVPDVSRVVYDITAKPPATMEWE